MISAGVFLILVASSSVYLFSFGASNVKSPSVIDCARMCQSRDGCLKFSFEPGKRVCHLHTTEGEPGRSKHSSDKGLIGQWICGPALSRDLEGPCSDHKWNVGKICSVNTATQRWHCGDLCQVPPGVTNATVSSGGQARGSSRTYTCLDGYLDTTSFVTSGVSTCLPDNTWSPVNLTCSESGEVKVASATQSSTDQNGAASRALDGNKSPRFWDLSCSHTKEELHPWLLLKLAGLSRVTGVELTNREDCCYKRLTNFTIKVSTNDPTSSNETGEICKHYTGTVDMGASELINCKSHIVGRYVKITLEQYNNTYLTVCEAVVKGVDDIRSRVKDEDI